ncbi:uncharacterized protein DMAD_01448 [Drosophila madeirensis]|uniref:Uncharacterized protein n=1 Tax=Drosophila madeirensis TaxID=30013 RepID=A0AAU9G2G5_DROMD
MPPLRASLFGTKTSVSVSGELLGLNWQRAGAKMLAQPRGAVRFAASRHYVVLVQQQISGTKPNLSKSRIFARGCSRYSFSPSERFHSRASRSMGKVDSC